ncbi:hypothetical protein RUM44_006099 [Polyplax serrata]|uniref:Uncharacterized protein n=1 Tax=Polyplax serrata TaxID=468196 RepID=A0ABR1AYY1_POLSC
MAEKLFLPFNYWKNRRSRTFPPREKQKVCSRTQRAFSEAENPPAAQRYRILDIDLRLSDLQIRTQNLSLRIYAAMRTNNMHNGGGWSRLSAAAASSTAPMDGRVGPSPPVHLNRTVT